MNRTAVLASGILVLVAADIVLALLPSVGGVALGVILWGLHMGLTQGLLAALVADTAPAELRGTAYGFFNLLGGVAMLAASVIAGALWDIAGPQGTFLAGGFGCGFLGDKESRLTFLQTAEFAAIYARKR
jgi:MFS family permease